MTNIIKDLIYEPTIKLKMETNIKYTHAIRDLVFLINDFLRLGSSPFISLEANPSKFRFGGKQISGYAFTATIIQEDYKINNDIFKEVLGDIIKKLAELNKYTFVNKINFLEVFSELMVLIPETNKNKVLSEYQPKKNKERSVKI